MIHTNFFDEERWDNFLSAKIGITDDRRLTVSPLVNGSGASMKIGLNQGAQYVFSLDLDRSEIPSTQPLLFAIRDGNMNILVSQEVNESGLIYQQYTALQTGIHFVTITQPTVDTVGPAFYLDNYYVYAMPTSGQDFVSLYLPDVLAYNDYYPFGMLIPNRFDSIEDYRYGFNGMEKDDEIKGEGNNYDYGARMYDSRVGKFLSLDPLYKDYPFYSPFQFAGNSPIMAIDLDGLEMQISNTVMTMKEGKGSSELTFQTDISIHYKILNLTGKKIEGINRITDWARDRSKLIYSDNSGLGSYTINFDNNNNYTKTAINYKLIGNIKKFISTFSVASSIKDIKDNDYVIILIDQRVKGAKYNFKKTTPPAYVNNIGGNVMVIDIGHPDYNAKLTNGVYNFDLMTEVAKKIANTINHETGHNLGLDDKYSYTDGKPKKGYENNVMGDSSKRELTPEQISEILNDIFTNTKINNYWKKKTGKEQTDETGSQLEKVLKVEQLDKP